MGLGSSDRRDIRDNAIELIHPLLPDRTDQQILDLIHSPWPGDPPDDDLAESERRLRESG